MRSPRAKCRATNQNTTSNRAYPAQAANFVRSIDFAGNWTGAARFPITWPTILSLVPADGEPKSRKFVLHGPPVPLGLLVFSLVSFTAKEGMDELSNQKPYAMRYISKTEPISIPGHHAANWRAALSVPRRLRGLGLHSEGILGKSYGGTRASAFELGRVSTLAFRPLCLAAPRRPARNGISLQRGGDSNIRLAREANR